MNCLVLASLLAVGAMAQPDAAHEHADHSQDLVDAVDKAATLDEHVAGPAPAGAPGPAPGDGIQGFVDLLPYSPDRMNFYMVRTRCIDFVNHMLEKAGNDATILPKLMPKCLWTKPECDTLLNDFLSRIPSSAYPAGPAAAPVAAPAAVSLLTVHRHAKADRRNPGSGDEIFGWCDTMYNMAKTRFFAKLKPKGLEPGLAPLPEETGNPHLDKEIMDKWVEQNLAGKTIAVMKDTKEAIENAVERAKQRSKEAWYGVKQKSSDAWEGTKSKSKEVYDGAAERGAETKEAFKRGGQNIKDRSGEAAEATKKKAGEAVEATNEAGRKATEKTKKVVKALED